MIIIARNDSRFPENGQSAGRAVTDNAGGVPSAMDGAAGMPTSAAGGAGLNLGVGLLVGDDDKDFDSDQHVYDDADRIYGGDLFSTS